MTPTTPSLTVPDKEGSFGSWVVTAAVDFFHVCERCEYPAYFAGGETSCWALLWGPRRCYLVFLSWRGELEVAGRV